MDNITSGNLNEQSQSDRRGWFIGHFMEKDSIFHSDQFEVKWGVHPKGEKKSQAAAAKTAKTVSVLISGKFALSFPESDNEIVLAEAGDYVYWDANVFHTYEAMEDSVILTFRWPSVSGDQIKMI